MCINCLKDKNKCVYLLPLHSKIILVYMGSDGLRLGAIPSVAVYLLMRCASEPVNHDLFTHVTDLWILCIFLDQKVPPGIFKSQEKICLQKVDLECLSST